jgi:RNA polymerase sigma-70 factor (ECF subfamily)
LIEKEYSDEQLVRVLQQDIGDKQKAMNELFGRYSNKMLEFFYYSFNRDKEKAKDFAQDLFLKLVEKPESFNIDKNFKSWFFSIASNMCKNEYRKKGTENKYAEFVVHDSKSAKSDEGSFKMNEALRYLKPSQKNCIILRYKFKMSIKEMSKVLDCPEGTVRSQLFYATKELSKHIKK